MDNELGIAIYGASGHARAIAAEIQRGVVAPQLARRVLAYIDDFVGGAHSLLDGVPVLPFEQWRAMYPSMPCLLSMGAPASKAKLRAKVELAGASFVDLYADRPPHLFEHVTLGIGSIVFDHTYIAANTSIGAHTHIMPLSSIGHDVRIGDCCTICPSTTVSGYVVIEDGVFIGAGTTIVDGTDRAPLRIGRGARIWAGSVVTRSVAPGASVAGNPAVPLRALVQRRRTAAA